MSPAYRPDILSGIHNYQTQNSTRGKLFGKAYMKCGPILDKSPRSELSSACLINIHESEANLEVAGRWSAIDVHGGDGLKDSLSRRG